LELCGTEKPLFAERWAQAQICMLKERPDFWPRRAFLFEEFGSEQCHKAHRPSLIFALFCSALQVILAATSLNICAYMLRLLAAINLNEVYNELCISLRRCPG